MAFPLLILTIMAAASNVFADKYLWKIRCDGAYPDVYCEIPGMDVEEVKYYQLEIIEKYPHKDDYQPCTSGYYRLALHNNKPSIRVGWACHALFGLKRNYTGFPYEGKCGQNNYGYRIIKGTKAKECQFPWMVYVRLSWALYEYYGSCGGSIINENWILTAGHCIIKQNGNGLLPPPEAVYVRTGTLYKWENYVQRKLRSIVVHPDYTWKHLTNDVALLQLDKPIKWDNCHAPVCLNKQRNVDKTTNLTCMISGWGNQHPREANYAKHLMWAYDKILTREECNRIYRSLSNEQTLCSRAASNGNSGFCAGDSGGPLVCKSEKNGRFYQHGVVSLYYTNAFCAMEGLYSSVANYYPWIKKEAFDG